MSPCTAQATVWAVSVDETSRDSMLATWNWQQTFRVWDLVVAVVLFSSCCGRLCVHAGNTTGWPWPAEGVGTLCGKASLAWRKLGPRATGIRQREAEGGLLLPSQQRQTLCVPLVASLQAAGVLRNRFVISVCLWPACHTDSKSRIYQKIILLRKFWVWRLLDTVELTWRVYYYYLKKLLFLPNSSARSKTEGL